MTVAFLAATVGTGTEVAAVKTGLVTVQGQSVIVMVWDLVAV